MNYCEHCEHCNGERVDGSAIREARLKRGLTPARRSTRARGFGPLHF